MVTNGSTVAIILIGQLTGGLVIPCKLILGVSCHNNSFCCVFALFGWHIAAFILTSANKCKTDLSTLVISVIW